MIATSRARSTPAIVETSMARACGHDHLNKFHKTDLATWNDQMAKLTGVAYAGFDAP